MNGETQADTIQKIADFIDVPIEKLPQYKEGMFVPWRGNTITIGTKGDSPLIQYTSNYSDQDIRNLYAKGYLNKTELKEILDSRKVRGDLNGLKVASARQVFSVDPSTQEMPVSGTTREMLKIKY